ncbi:Ig-like domain-containing protein [Ottowia thiooxydans]|uniref:Cadherin domain-containing protein n=1 Tax=Ottowia thiooxydans TaxID=219182 RepID=A0ABV2QGN2_9BURK
MRSPIPLIFAATVLFASQVFAQTTTHSAYLDIDSNASTGCTVSTASGTVSGVEVSITATVDGDPPQVVSVARAECTEGVFGAPEVMPASYPVGLSQGDGGSDTVEFSSSLDGLKVGRDVPAFFVSGNSTGGSDLAQGFIRLPSAVDVATGAVFAVPATGWLAVILLTGAMLWLVRKYPGASSTLVLVLMVSVAGGSWAAFLADGHVTDWNGHSPVTTDPIGDSSDGRANIDIVSVYAATDASQLHLRFDIQDLEAVNQAPTLAAGTFSVAENSANGTEVGTALASDPDAGQTLTYSITSGNSGGAFSIDPLTGVIRLVNASALNFQTTTSVSLTISVADNGVPPLDASALFAINLIKVNHAPSFTKGADPTVLEDAGPVSLPGWASNLTDNDQNTQTLSFTVSNNNSGLFSTPPSVDSTGTLTFQSAPNAYGSAIVTVVLQDSGGVANGGIDTSAPQTFTITVQPVDDLPVAIADQATTTEDFPVTINVLANDTDIDAGTAASLLSFTQPANGTVLQVAQNLIYAPAANYCNSQPGGTPDTFTYTIQPGGSSATVSVRVQCVDDSPVANNDAATVEQDSGATAINVLANDSDVEGDAMTILSVTQPANGTVAITGGGTGLTYQPNAGYSGPDSFTYLINGGSSATVSITVNPTLPPITDLGEMNLYGSCGILGVLGPGFTLTASPTHPIPVGTQITITGSGVANIGVFSVSGGTASVSILSGTSRLVTLTSSLPAGATIAFRTTLSISVAFQLAGQLTLPAGYESAGGKLSGSVSSTLILCSAT